MLPVNYRAYMASQSWQIKKNQALARAEYRCQKCGQGMTPETWSSQPYSEHLKVHHLTYERLGSEWPTDLQVLCHHCHSRVHGRPLHPLEYTTSPDDLLRLSPSSPYNEFDEVDEIDERDYRSYLSNRDGL